MFRQVVMCRWADGVSAEAKQDFRDAVERLRSIPELLDLRWGEDAGHFEGNFDFVAVMDFADFASARRYVEHPVHQSYVRDHASRVVGERAVVQHDWFASDGR
jgi:Stress responsive A/B Barrel Domain